LSTVCFVRDKCYRFDYRPFIVNWCIKVCVLDGCEVTDKEGWELLCWLVEILFTLRAS